jgi:HK97 family phage major capsid protein
VRNAERQRVLAINTLAEKFTSPNGRALAKKAIEENMSADAFGMALLEDRGQAKAIDASNPESAQGYLGMDGGDLRKYSIGNAVRMHMGLAKKEGVEWEAHRELEKKGISAQRGGILVPNDPLRMPMAVRSQEATTPSKGGVLVQQTNLGFDELLRNRMMTRALGVRSLPGLRDNVAIPRMSSGSTAYWLSPEGQDITESEAAFGQVTLSPKTVGALVSWTRQLAMQANPAIDAIMADDLNMALALAIDLAVLHGTGADGQPLGIANTSGVAAPTLATADWAKVVSLETLVAMANADVNSMALLTTPAFRGTLKTREKASGTAQFIWADNSVNGYRADVSNQVSSGHAFFGDWTRAVLGEWGVLELAVSEHTKFANGGIALRGLQTVDVAVRQPGAFAVSSDAS